jgi:hypothetical protein
VLGSGHLSMVESSNAEAAARQPRSKNTQSPPTGRGSLLLSGRPPWDLPGGQTDFGIAVIGLPGRAPSGRVMLRDSPRIVRVRTNTQAGTTLEVVPTWRS